ncbi:MAG: mechanosensitive ion channel [Lachnospiraceae bacterium]|nr:mechanosensitive ion channel [Lachnospiraceae bacterium]
MFYSLLEADGTVAEKAEKSVNWFMEKIDLILPVVWNIILCLVIFFVGRKLIKWIISLIKKGFTKAKFDESISGFLLSIINAVLYVLLIFIFLEILGIGTASIITLVGSVGLTVGLALQGSLSNFAGGVLILILRPFKVGDFISANGIDGTVTAIDIFYTKLRTPDLKNVDIPNGTLMNSVVTNVSAYNVRRHDITASVSYSTDIDLAKKVLADMVRNSGFAVEADDTPIMVFVSEYGASSIDFNVRFWVKAEQYWDAKFYVMENIKKSFDAAGIEIPFNQLDVHLDK